MWPARDRRLLDAHGDAKAVFGFDEVVVVVEAEVELDPVDLAGEALDRVVAVTGDPNSSPTSQVSSAENRKASVCSMRPSPTATPSM